MTLSAYIDQVQELVRDTNTQFYSRNQVIRSINGARSQIAKMTGCINGLVAGSAPYGNQTIMGQAIIGGLVVGYQGDSNSQTSAFNTIVGQEEYKFQGVANAFARQLYAGVKGIIAVNDVACSWGGIRPALSYIDWESLQAYARSYNVGVSSYPFYWSVMPEGENGSVWLFPFPSAIGEMEWFCNFAPSPIYTDLDVDVLPQPFTDGVQYWAARKLFLSAGRNGDAQDMIEEFKHHVGIDRLAVDPGKVADYYFESGLF